MHPAVKYHDALAPHWEDNYERISFVNRDRLILNGLRDEDVVGKQWLDAGCGTGRLARRLAQRGALVRGVDASCSMIEVAQRQAERERVTGQVSFDRIETIENLPFAGDTFDGVLCSSVLEYVDDPVVCLRELRRVLKADGLLIVSVPNRWSAFRIVLSVLFTVLPFVRKSRQWAYFRFSRHQYSRSEFQRILERQHFAVTRIDLFGGPFPLWLQWSRLGASLLLFAAKKNRGPDTPQG